MKNKAIALMGAIVLCSLFFVALPATTIAAEEDDYVLDIYGNANEDDTIDMRDLTYVKLIFFGKKPETELADAKYDGKINPLDFIQIKLIIVGKEKELTVVDTADRIVTIDMPVERTVILFRASATVIKAIGAEDKVVGVGDTITGMELFFPELSQLPCVGYTWGPDPESIIALEPDLVIIDSWNMGSIIEALEPTGIPVAVMVHAHSFTYKEEVKKLGYITGKKDSTDEYLDWYQGILDSIAEKVEGISEEDKQRVFYTNYPGYPGKYGTFGGDSCYGLHITMAGGINIAADLTGEFRVVEQEWVTKQNPSVIVSRSVRGMGYGVDEPSEELEADYEDIMDEPALMLTDAVKDGNVYTIATEVADNHFIAVPYMAKCFYPYLDLDPNAIHQEWLTRFQRIDYDLDEHGVFVYHPVLHPDGK